MKLNLRDVVTEMEEYCWQALREHKTVLPKRLMDAGFRFLFPEIDQAVRDCVA